MKKIIINGGNLLEGEIQVSGSKNSALAILCASLLARDKVTLANCPDIEDITNLFHLLEFLGVQVTRSGDTVVIDSSNIQDIPIMHEDVSKFRASYYLMGAYLALFHKVDISMPGGCNLGDRPFDLHLKAFKRLNCEYTVDEVSVHILSERLQADKVFLEIPSVGATINTILASVFIEGITTIQNAAKEPEIIDVVKFLNRLGAKITGAGTTTITIEGVKRLTGGEYRIMADRIEAGTYTLIASAKGKEVDIVNFEQVYQNGLVAKLIEAKVKFRLYPNRIKILPTPYLLPIELKTSYYPGFPTDLQQIFTALLTQARGVSTVTDHIYHKRFNNCYELNKMGAKVVVEDNKALIYGPSLLHGTTVKATDLRGGASLILAGLIAQGETIIENAEHIFRGYSGIIEKIKGINGDIHLD